MAGIRRIPVALLVTWAATRLLLLLFVFKVLVFPGPDVTSDVAYTYRGWYEVLSAGTYPLDDVTWQYPPVAALPVLSPALLPFLGYAEAFFVLACLADLAVLVLLLYACRGRSRTLRGVWVWVVGVPLIGPTVYARYDVMVTAVAVAALLAGARRPRVLGALVAFGALLKVWPALLLLGAARLRTWVSAAVTAVVLAALCALWLPGAFAFLTFQRDRGTEVESLGALVFHVARWFGWDGRVVFHYGSMEFMGPYVEEVSTAALGLSALAFGWLLLWRLRVRHLTPRTLAEAAFVAVLMFTVTSRVISPQYMVWLVGLAAVCLCFRDSVLVRPAYLVVAASLVTALEFPVWFAEVVASDWWGVTLLVVRNGLLVAAAVLAARELWRSTVTAPSSVSVPGQASRAGRKQLTS